MIVRRESTIIDCHGPFQTRVLNPTLKTPALITHRSLIDHSLSSMMSFKFGKNDLSSEKSFSAVLWAKVSGENEFIL